MNEAFTALTENGFVISRESHAYDTSRDTDPKFTTFTVHRTSNETLLLLQKRSKLKKFKYIEINSTPNFTWLTEVQNSITKEKNEDVVLYVENEPQSGILGLTNCLRREPQSKNVRCVFVVDEAEKFGPQVPFYSNQLRKQMAVNVYKDGQWGTYRHLPLDKWREVESEHCYANVLTRGDLTSLRWIEGPLRHDTRVQPEKEVIHVSKRYLKLI